MALTKPMCETLDNTKRLSSLQVKHPWPISKTRERCENIAPATVQSACCAHALYCTVERVLRDILDSEISMKRFSKLLVEIEVACLPSLAR